MFKKVKISGLTGSIERPGYASEELIVRDGTERPFELIEQATCAISPHEIRKGEQAYVLPDQKFVCTTHVADIMTTDQFTKYYSQQY